MVSFFYLVLGIVCLSASFATYPIWTALLFGLVALG